MEESDSFLRIMTLLALLVSLSISWRIYRFTIGNSERQSLIKSISEFNVHREELEIVLNLEGIPYGKWSNEQKRAASVICFDLFHLGHFIQYGHVPLDFCELYYYTIPKTREILAEYIDAVRLGRNGNYWKKFDDLVVITSIYTKNHRNGKYFVDCKATLISDTRDINRDILRRAKGIG